MPFATHRTLLLACALVATRDAARLMRLQVHQASILRAALDVRTGDAVRCNNNRKEKERKSSKQNFTSHTFKADLGELQFLSFFRVFYYFLFLCLAISGSTFNGPLRAYPGQKIMWTLAGVACCLRLSPLRFRVCRRQLEILFPVLGTSNDSWDAQLWMFVLAAESSSSKSYAW